MNAFHNTKYTVYCPHKNYPTRIAIISDLHFACTITNQKLENIKNYLKEQNPTYITIIGDTLDSIESIEIESEKQRLLNWLKDLGTICPVLISIGGHDFYKKYPRTSLNDPEWIFYFDEQFFNEIKQLPNIHLLHNSSYETEQLYAMGYTQSFEYYYQQTKKLTEIFKITEDKNLMLKELRELKRDLIHNLPEEKLKLALIHSPIHLKEPVIMTELSEFDYFLSGHMHNGCVPPLLYEIFNSSRGLIAPNKSIFPPNTRNTLKTNTDKLIVNGPLTMFQKDSKKIQSLNILFPTYISTLEITQDPKYHTKKISRQTNYQKFD